MSDTQDAANCNSEIFDGSTETALINQGSSDPSGGPLEGAKTQPGPGLGSIEGASYIAQSAGRAQQALRWHQDQRIDPSRKS